MLTRLPACRLKQTNEGFIRGTRALPGYVRGIIKDEINPKPAPRVLTGAPATAPATALIDADNSLGHVAGEYAMKMAIEKASAP